MLAASEAPGRAPRTGPDRAGTYVTCKQGGESNHDVLSSVEVPWPGLLLSKFTRLMKAAAARVQRGGNWPHFEVVG